MVERGVHVGQGLWCPCGPASCTSDDVSTPQLHACRYLAVSPNEEHLACSLENNQLYTLLLSNNEIMKADEMNFDVLGTNNHQVSGLGGGLCLWRGAGVSLVRLQPKEILSFTTYGRRTTDPPGEDNTCNIVTPSE